jgi:hypothetical protein
MELWALNVFKSPFPKKRYGQPYDGGYVVCEIPDITYDLFLSGGVADDDSFECAFLDAHPSLHCYAFDNTECEVNHPRCTFIQKYIATNNNNFETNLHEYIDNHETIFLKMDIEGGEYPFFWTLQHDDMDKFAQIVIEFHKPFLPHQAEVLKTISKTHYMVHLQSNNCCGTEIIDGRIVPNIFECTYIHKRYIQNPQFNTEALPMAIDMPNVITKPDILINHPPFVYQEDAASKRESQKQ